MMPNSMACIGAHSGVSLCMGFLAGISRAKLPIGFGGQALKAYESLRFLVANIHFCLLRLCYVQSSSDYPAIMGLCCFRIIGYLFPLDINLIHNCEI